MIIYNDAKQWRRRRWLSGLLGSLAVKSVAPHNAAESVLRRLLKLNADRLISSEATPLFGSMTSRPPRNLNGFMDVEKRQVGVLPEQESFFDVKPKKAKEVG